ncbi:uncharacterized protein LOC134664734 [Cydia fagiglandana]|uniref:uncharacterized protein LOC134664734 n=1 Tax=Cydia fagiglandana TaxID=1458189 RepID=UPI002FEE5D40
MGQCVSRSHPGPFSFSRHYDAESLASSISGYRQAWKGHSESKGAKKRDKSVGNGNGKLSRGVATSFGFRRRPASTSRADDNARRKKAQDKNGNGGSTEDLRAEEVLSGRSTPLARPRKETAGQPLRSNRFGLRQQPCKTARVGDVGPTAEPAFVTHKESINNNALDKKSTNYPPLSQVTTSGVTTIVGAGGQPKMVTKQTVILTYQTQQYPVQEGRPKQTRFECPRAPSATRSQTPCDKLAGKYTLQTNQLPRPQYPAVKHIDNTKNAKQVVNNNRKAAASVEGWREVKYHPNGKKWYSGASSAVSSDSGVYTGEAEGSPRTRRRPRNLEMVMRGAHSFHLRELQDDLDIMGHSAVSSDSGVYMGKAEGSPRTRRRPRNLEMVMRGAHSFHLRELQDDLDIMGHSAVSSDSGVYMGEAEGSPRTRRRPRNLEMVMRGAHSFHLRELQDDLDIMGHSAVSSDSGVYTGEAEGSPRTRRRPRNLEMVMRGAHSFHLRELQDDLNIMGHSAVSSDSGVYTGEAEGSPRTRRRPRNLEMVMRGAHSFHLRELQDDLDIMDDAVITGHTVIPLPKLPSTFDEDLSPIYQAPSPPPYTVPSPVVPKPSPVADSSRQSPMSTLERYRTRTRPSRIQTVDYKNEEKFVLDKAQPERLNKQNSFIKSSSGVVSPTTVSSKESSPSCKSEESHFGNSSAWQSHAAGEAMATRSQDDVSIALSVSSCEDDKSKLGDLPKVDDPPKKTIVIDDPPVPHPLLMKSLTLSQHDSLRGTMMGSMTSSNYSTTSTCTNQSADHHLTLTLEDSKFDISALEISTQSLLDDETSPADSLISSTSTSDSVNELVVERDPPSISSAYQTANTKTKSPEPADEDGVDGELLQTANEVVEETRNGEDSKNVSPESPGTPTHASGSLSLSDGRDFFDDEIADQPALLFRSEYLETRNGEDSKKVSPESPGTPTHASGSLSLSDGRDFFDDEIADQPALLFRSEYLETRNGEDSKKVSPESPGTPTHASGQPLLFRSEYLETRNGEDSKKVSPESPGTPTHASGSLSLSDGRDFFDDEIADQPALLFRKNNEGSPPSKQESENSKQLRRSRERIPASPLAQRNRKVNGLRNGGAERTPSLDTLSSLASDDLMMDNDLARSVTSLQSVDDYIERLDSSLRSGLNSLDERQLRQELSSSKTAVRQWSQLLEQNNFLDRQLAAMAQGKSTTESLTASNTSLSNIGASLPVRTARLLQRSRAQTPSDAASEGTASPAPAPAPASLLQDVVDIKTLLLQLKRVLQEARIA